MKIGWGLGRSKAENVPTSFSTTGDGDEKPQQFSQTSTQDLENQHVQSETQDEGEYPSLKVALPIVLSVCLASFLISLDRTIVGVAVPKISDDFQSFSDISWYESAYLLTFAALQLPMGKVYTYLPAKWVFITNVVIFEVGSIISAASPTSTAFIIGRAISGIASAGLATGTQIIIIDLFPLEQRPKYQGFLGATFGLASIAGPLLGGVFTTKVTWRWCFWINLPIGGLAVAILLILLPNKKPPLDNSKDTLWQRIQQFDPLGLLLIIPGLILLLLGLQWGSGDGSWSSPRVLGTLIAGGVMMLAFVVFEWWHGEDGIVPRRIIGKRTVAAACFVSLGFGSALVIITFYLPIWYQAAKNLSAVEAGVRMLPYFLITVVFVIISGILVSKTGYYAPWAILGTAMSMVGCGLLSTLSSGTSEARSIGYQVVVSFGLGLTLVQPINAIQAVLSREDVALGLTLSNFANFAGGTIFVSVCQAILASTLASELSQQLPDVNVYTLLGSGVTNIANEVKPEQIPLIRNAYSKGIDNVFYCAVGVLGFAFISSLFLKWDSIKPPKTAVKEEEGQDKKGASAMIP